MTSFEMNSFTFQGNKNEANENEEDQNVTFETSVTNAIMTDADAKSISEFETLNDDTETLSVKNREIGTCQQDGKHFISKQENSLKGLEIENEMKCTTNEGKRTTTLM